MELPQVIRDSGLWKRLQGQTELAAAIGSLRETAGALADTISRLLPEYTDHSIRHMDMLWRTADVVLTAEETEALSVGESFILAASFYLHDLGMAFAATELGLGEIQRSNPYRQFLSRMRDACRDPDAWEELRPSMERRAVSLAVRQLHAELAYRLATEPIPGVGTFLIEPQRLREAWGPHVGRVAESHHWNLDRVEAELGRQGQIPLAGAHKGDLGFVACLLRLIDYAHINRDRASTIERALRQDIPAESLMHWLAQERIDGPHRDGAELIYSSAGSIGDVDAWWLYYQMLCGLDAEIRNVRRYLDQRHVSHGRLSLASVRGASSPEDCAAFIQTDGFIPIEVNIRTGSIERLVEILGGESLYGPNKIVPLRELIQNAVDALALKSVTAHSDPERQAAGFPIQVTLTSKGEPTLEVADHGVGMSRKVMQDYLVTIASDYWRSDQFYSDFPQATERGFRPAGRFGIGFISVFMISDEARVSSNREGAERLQLSLRGVGRRGEIRTLGTSSGSGTSVALKLRADSVEAFERLPHSVRCLAPMVENPLRVDADGSVTTIEPGWWLERPVEDFIKATNASIRVLEPLSAGRVYDPPSVGARIQVPYPGLPYWYRGVGQDDEAANPWSRRWPEWRNRDRRIVAHPFHRMTVICSRGIALSTIYTPGFVGFVNVDEVVPDASRTHARTFSAEQFLREARTAVKASVVENLNGLSEQAFVTPNLEFVETCMALYGTDVVRDSSIRWVSAVRPPGDIEMLNSLDLLERIVRSECVRLSEGTGPWTSMKRWAGAEVLRSERDVEIVLGTDVRGLRYDEEKITGSLDKLVPRRSVGLSFVLELIAEGWQVPIKDLIEAETWDLQRDRLFGELKRPRQL